ncbi:hypothetical protein HK101_010759 [Irineochytrium annulatum]|nr:hypothetical protein HK101_010759 [Irineochytrium annulatum]
MPSTTAPFNIEESTFLVQPRLPATDELFPNAMSTCSADAEKAQLALGCKYTFSPTQWLVFWRKAEGPSAKSGLRCVVQVGTVFSVLTGRYRSPQGEIKLNRAALRQAVVETRLFDIGQVLNLKKGGQDNYSSGNSNSNDDNYTGQGELSSQESMFPVKAATVSARVRAAALSNAPVEAGPKIIVVEGDTMNVALQLRRVFKHTPAAMVPINGSIPGGFYRRGGGSAEEEICRRSNLWDCLDDPYGHSVPDPIPSAQGSASSVAVASATASNSSVAANAGNASKGKRGAPKPLGGGLPGNQGSRGSMNTRGDGAGGAGGGGSGAGRPYHLRNKKRGWSYPVSESQAVYAPGVYVFRASESEGYSFLRQPGRVSCICVVADMNRDAPSDAASYANGVGLPRLRTFGSNQSLVNAGVNKAAGGSGFAGQVKSVGAEPRMGVKAAKAYARKVEFIMKIAMKEQRRVLVLGALGCGAHATPPRHAAEIHRMVLQAVDPRGDYFDLVAFAIVEDQNSFRSHNPDGNLKPFADILTSGIVTPLTELESTPEVTDPDEAPIPSTRHHTSVAAPTSTTARGAGYKDSVFGRPASLGSVPTLGSQRANGDNGSGDVSVEALSMAPSSRTTLASSRGSFGSGSSVRSKSVRFDGGASGGQSMEEGLIQGRPLARRSGEAASANSLVGRKRKGKAQSLEFKSSDTLRYTGGTRISSHKIPWK